jgi:signal transduction histidine kinase
MEANEALAAFLKGSGTKDGQIQAHLAEAERIKEEIDFGYIMGDFENVISESLEGLMRVAKIVADLKNFAHMKADETEWVDINTNIESTLNIVWNELKYKAEVIKELGELPQVRCFPQRINQVVMNLLVNAGQAIRERGRICIKTSAANGHVKIEISDSGEGIAPENLNKIFDPFFTTKEVGKGTGLGLNVAYNIIKSHKGRIDVQSTSGQGTTFSIELPVEPEIDDAAQLN